METLAHLSSEITVLPFYTSTQTDNIPPWALLFLIKADNYSVCVCVCTSVCVRPCVCTSVCVFARIRVNV